YSEATVRECRSFDDSRREMGKRNLMTIKMVESEHISDHAVRAHNSN
ncbi:unnamed protein product, partial [Urochloa humidicola]